MKSFRGYQSNGFTLVELLVVSVIILVLAVLVMPALKEMRTKAQQIQCMSNLSQIGKAIMMYSAETDGCLPPVYNANTDDTWYCQWGGQKGALAPYTERKWGEKSVFWCPSDPDGYSKQVSYFANASVMGKTVHSGSSTGPFKVASFTQPSKNILVIDSSVKLANPTYWIESGFPDSFFYPSPHVNGTKQNALYMDGHVELIHLNPKVDLRPQ
ncbi:MAG: type II secretion system protein [Phycisphaerae bacterium]|jgi:prepilin-type N-terminal cleavage/methylation domain-containing protein/prepilin-type processing-associated H-X9-DG protein